MAVAPWPGAVNGRRAASGRVQARQELPGRGPESLRFPRQGVGGQHLPAAPVGSASALASAATAAEPRPSAPAATCAQADACASGQACWRAVKAAPSAALPGLGGRLPVVDDPGGAQTDPGHRGAQVAAQIDGRQQPVRRSSR